MTRKVIGALSLMAAVVLFAGCKDEPTSMNFDAKGAYSGQQQYKGKGTTGQESTSKE
jgi:hypothetical protein